MTIVFGQLVGVNLISQEYQR